jgi:hypothetical protein
MLQEELFTAAAVESYFVTPLTPVLTRLREL